MSRVLRRAGGAVAVAAILFAGGCTGDDDPDSAPEAPAAPVPEGQPDVDVPATEDDGTEEGAAEEASEVPVLLIDNEVMLPASIYPAGTYTFVIEQEGESPSMLSIEGPGVSETSPEISPGAPGELTVTLEPGTYEMWSSVDGEPEEGSEVTIEVE